MTDSASEARQLFYQRVGEPTARRITDAKSIDGNALWSSSGHEIAFATIARDTGSCDIDIIDPDSGALPRLGGGQRRAWYPLDWSAGRPQAPAAPKHVSAVRRFLFILDLGTGQKREVDSSPPRAPSRTRSSRVTALACISFRSRQRPREAALRESFHRRENRHRRPWRIDVEQFALSEDGHYLAYVADEGGADKLNLLDLRAHQDLVTPRLAGTGRGGFLELRSRQQASALWPRHGHPAARRLCARRRGQPARAPGPRPKRGPSIARSSCVPRLTQFPTFDRLDGTIAELPLYMYEPASPGPHPVLIVLHDGPDARFRPPSIPGSNTSSTSSASRCWHRTCAVPPATAKASGRSRGAAA